MPAYRAARTIGRAIDSLLAQTRRPDEILVIDDGSPDDLPAALAAYGECVRLHRQPNGGAASARNRGIELATGNLIAFLDADDYWEPHKLERQLSILERHPEVGLVAANFYQQPLGRPRYPLRLPPEAHRDRVLRPRGTEALAVARRIWTSTVLVRREALGNHRFDATLPTAEDVDLWLRLVLALPVYLLTEPLATAVLEEGSLSRSDVASDARNMLAVLRRHATVLGRAGVRAWQANVYRAWAAGHLAKGEPGAAIKPAWNRLVRQPLSLQAWWVVLKATAWAAKQTGAGDKARSAAHDTT
jgi:glycosyltransferase involved in cell wall biosynthesis